MRARFIGDPAEREGENPLPASKPQGDWFDVPEGQETYYRKHSHYEVQESAPRRTRKPAADPAVEDDAADE